MSEFDPIKSLEEAGLLAPAPASHFQEGHKGGLARDVLSTLSEQEVEVLKSVRERMNEAVEEEVGAHTEVVGGVFW